MAREMVGELDRIDQKILKELEANGRLSIVDLATRVNLTNTPCSERVKRLERSGYISGYRAVLNMEQLGLGHLTIVQVSLAATAGDNSLDAFNRVVKDIPEVESCLMVAGSFDYLLTVRTRDIAHFRVVLGDKINKLPGIHQTNSFAVMEAVL
ncbi:Lrp/AsnC family transcriptional regulator [Pseudophaeobacter leonis]|uniref:Lrp/AsnC family transcriptional regulator n=1 Tax=Pseudophaeobacter leonis TaxID=1144477 RepID=UPI001F4F0B9A|nr:Lrp/AsnC ligand binding domain-containing protein [Pseudophaeobacter leonis]